MRSEWDRSEHKRATRTVGCDATFVRRFVPRTLGSRESGFPHARVFAGILRVIILHGVCTVTGQIFDTPPHPRAS